MAPRRLTVGGRNRLPIWSADGERVAFQSDMQPTLTFTNPTAVSSIGFLEGGPAYVRSYDLAPDGQHVLGVVSATQTTDAPRVPNIEVVVNWLDELRQRAPAR